MCQVKLRTPARAHTKTKSLVRRWRDGVLVVLLKVDVCIGSLLNAAKHYLSTEDRIVNDVAIY